MKKTYREQIDEIQFKEDFKEEIIMQALLYDKNKYHKHHIRNKIAVVATAILVVVACPILMKNFNGDVTPGRYTIKASDDLYEISNNEIMFKDYKTNTESYLFGANPTTGLLDTFPYSSPLSVFVKGDSIESITYTIHNGEFYKIYEGGELNDVNLRDIPGYQGLYGMTKEPNTLPQLTLNGNTLPGNPSLTQWWWSAKSNGTQITINYEDQGTVEGFYGISFHIIDQEATNAFGNDEMHDSINHKIIDAINHSKLDVRINYVGGTYTTTQLSFKIDK